MFTWDPGQYQLYGGLRMRPALDLLAQVSHPAPRLIYDVGTGRGDIARLMAERWPGARVVGTDTSAEMLASAGETEPRVEWVEQDVREWNPDSAPDIIYSNAVLHWVEDHGSLFPRLIQSLAGGGVLAVQMPLSWGEPSHLLMRETLAALDVGPSELKASLQDPPVAPAAFYQQVLRPHAADVSIWTTRYLQVLTGADPVFEWVSGTALRPILEALDPDSRERFVDRYRTLLRKAYPPEDDGSTLFPFPRLFIVARTP